MKHVEKSLFLSDIRRFHCPEIERVIFYSLLDLLIVLTPGVSPSMIKEKQQKLGHQIKFKHPIIGPMEKEVKSHQ